MVASPPGLRRCNPRFHGDEQLPDFMAYIDEAGDEGIGRGTKWFVLAGAIVERGAPSSQLGEILRAVKAQIELRAPVLHWAELSHIRRVAVGKRLAEAAITICAVLVDTHHPDMKQAALMGVRLYFYA